jgi:Methenyl tetrahydrofolate cyclohydrolase
MEKAGNKAQLIKQKLSKLVDDDTDAFNQVIEATRLPESNKEEKRVKDIALLKANKNAINFPLEVSKLSLEILELIYSLIEKINPNSISDLAVASEISFAAMRGGLLNIYINIKEVKSDNKFVDNVMEASDDTLTQATKLRDKIYTKSVQIINS